MNTLQILGMEPVEEGSVKPAETTLAAMVEQMHATAQAEQRRALIECASQHEVGYRKGKVAALAEVLEMFRTGKIPE